MRTRTQRRAKPKKSFRPRLELLDRRDVPSAGTLDITVHTDFGGGSAGTAVAMQPDAKIVVAGVTDGGPSGSDFAIARYNADGALDTTFSLDGKVTTDLSSGDDFA